MPPLRTRAPPRSLRARRAMLAWERGSTVPLTVTRDHLDAAVQRLLAALDPEEIVLFGSQARGDARPDSDADLLLILPPRAQSMPVSDRERVAWNAVRGDPMLPSIDADVFTYTVAEIHDRLAHGDTVVRDALTEGAVLFPSGGLRSRYAGFAGEWSRMGTVDRWMQYAATDLRDAQAAGLSTRNVAYHAQQAAEKALKALTFHCGGEPERTHDLPQLLLDITILAPALGRRLLLAHQNALADLTRFAVTPRYPGATEVSIEQAQAAVSTAQALLTAVRAAMTGEP